MTRFRDGMGREWTFHLDVLAIKRVKAGAGVELNKLLDDGMKLYRELTEDPARFLEVMFVLIGEEAAKRKLEFDDFLAGYTGDTLEATYAAFQEEFQNFSPARVRTILKKATETTRATQDKATEKVLARIELAGQKALEAIDKAPVEVETSTSSNSPTSSPESPASAIPEG